MAKRILPASFCPRRGRRLKRGHDVTPLSKAIRAGLGLSALASLTLLSLDASVAWELEATTARDIPLAVITTKRTSLFDKAAAGATFTVTKLEDTDDGICDSDCSLREAVTAANGNDNGPDFVDHVVFDSTVTGTIVLAGEEILVSDELVIDGPGVGRLTVDANYDPTDPEGESRVFYASSATSMTRISGLALTHGYTFGDSGGAIFSANHLSLDAVTIQNSYSGDLGGGFYVQSGDATLQSSAIIDNISDDGGGGFVMADGNATISNSNISNNFSHEAGGGFIVLGDVTLVYSAVHGNSADVGGGFYGQGNVTLTSSTVKDNTAKKGGGFAVNLGDTLVENSTLSGNVATDFAGGGFYAVGYAALKDSIVYDNAAEQGPGGGFYLGGNGLLRNSTVSSNTAGSFGGGFHLLGEVFLTYSTVKDNEAGVNTDIQYTGQGGGGASAFDSINASHSTISGNSARLAGGGLAAYNAIHLYHTTVTNNVTAQGYGGGLYVSSASLVTGIISLQNSIVAGNSAAIVGQDIFNGTITSAYSLIGISNDASPGGFTESVGSILGTRNNPADARLAPLADNGGPTWTHAIDKTSPAYNAGDPDFELPLVGRLFDQRGAPAARVSSGRLDMGAYELQADPILGLLSDQARSGHGMDLQKVGNNYFFTFYTHGEDRSSEWYQLVAKLVNGDLQGELFHFVYDSANAPQSVGEAQLEFGVSGAAAGCDDGVDRSGAFQLVKFSWTIRGKSGTWCLNPLIVGGAPPSPDFTGTWYAGAVDTGWGITISQQGTVLVAIVYFYDAEGNPRWVLGSTQNFSNGDTLDMLEFTGYCRDCEFFRETEQAGTLKLTLTTPSQDFDDNQATVNLEYLGAEGGTWERSNVPIKLLSDPAP